MSSVIAIFRFIIGAVFGIACALALVPAVTAFNPASGDSQGSALILLLVILGGGLLSAFAPTVRRAFGRGFLLLGVSLLALPISALLLSGRVASDMLSTADPDIQGAAAIGAGLAGAAIAGVATFFGLILGFIMLIAGLVLSLGGRREVIVTSHPSGAAFGQRVEPAAPQFSPPPVRKSAESGSPLWGRSPATKIAL